MLCKHDLEFDWCTVCTDKDDVEMPDPNVPNSGVHTDVYSPIKEDDYSEGSFP